MTVSGKGVAPWAGPPRTGRRRAKLAALFFATFLALTLVMAAVLYGPMVGRFERLGDWYLSQDVAQAMGQLAERRRDAERSVSDYAVWDETFQFLEEYPKGADAYMETNLGEESLDRLGMDLALLVDRRGRVLEHRRWRGGELDAGAVVEALMPALAPGGPLLGSGDGIHRRSGFLAVGGVVLTVSACSVHPTSGAGPPAGWLVFGRVTREIMEAAPPESRVNTMRLVAAPGSAKAEGVRLRTVALGASPGKLEVMRQSDGDLMVRSGVEDVLGGLGLVLEIGGLPDIGRAARGVAGWILALASGMVLVVLAGAFWAVEFYLFGRLSGLRGAVVAMKARPDPRARLAFPGDDEVGDVAEAMNGLLDELEGVTRRAAELEGCYRAAVEQSIDGVFIAEAGGLRITDANAALRAMLGYGPEGAFPETLHALDTGAGTEIGVFAGAASDGGRGVRGRRVFRARDGELVEVLVSLTWLHHAGRPHVFGIVSDLREERRLEDAIARARHQEAAGRLASGLAHDLNNLMAVILGSADFLGRGKELSNASRAEVASIQQAAESASRLVERLLHYARRVPASSREVQIRDLLARAAPMVRSAVPERIRIDWLLEAEAPACRLDPGGFEQALLNLVLNARDAMDGDGAIRVRLASQAPTEGGKPVRGAWACVEVEDTGRGIRPEVRAQLFEPFFTTKGPGRGSGLGLAMVKAFVDQHGGRVEVESAPGQGAVFRLYFPAAAGAPMSGTIEAARNRAGCVLLVDDEPAIRRILERVLADAGFRVVLAASGEMAMEAARGTPERVDVLVTDILMPGGMNGIDLARQLREGVPMLPVVLISGQERAVLEPDALAALLGSVAPVRCIAKPFKPDDLVRVVREFAGAENAGGKDA